MSTQHIKEESPALTDEAAARIVAWMDGESPDAAFTCLQAFLFLESVTAPEWQLSRSHSRRTLNALLACGVSFSHRDGLAVLVSATIAGEETVSPIEPLRARIRERFGNTVADIVDATTYSETRTLEQMRASLPSIPGRVGDLARVLAAGRAIASISELLLLDSKRICTRADEDTVAWAGHLLDEASPVGGFSASGRVLFLARQAKSKLCDVLAAGQED